MTEKFTLGHARGLTQHVADVYAEMARVQLERSAMIFARMPKPTPEQIAAREQREREHAERAEPFIRELRLLCEKHRIKLRAGGEDPTIYMHDRETLHDIAMIDEECPGPWRIL